MTVEATTQRGVTYRQLLTSYPDFRRLWAGQVVSEVGDWLSNIAVFALVIELAGRGHEGLAVAFYGLARHIPLFVCGPLAGVVTDRMSRRRVMIWADIARAVLAVFFLFADHYRSLWLIYLVGACLFAVSTFFNAAKRASLPSLVTTPAALLAANSLAASTTAATIALGSALGGIVATLAGRYMVFALNSATFILSAIFIARITTRLSAYASNETDIAETDFAPRPVRKIERVELEGESLAHSRLRRGYDDFRRGLSYVKRDPTLAAVFAVAAGWGLGNGAARALYTIFGARFGEQLSLSGFAHVELINHGRWEDFGISVLFVAMGLGGVIGAPLARRLGAAGEANLGDYMGRLLVLDGAALVAFSVMPNLWGAALALVCREICFAGWWTAQQTLIMRGTAQGFAGRVFASFETLTTLAMVCSMLVAGAAADRFGMRPVALLGGVTVALSGAAWFGVKSETRRYRRAAPTEQHHDEH